MTNRRADATPGLLGRVRWGNVGRLVALLAGVILLATGPHGCGPGQVAGGSGQVAGPLVGLKPVVPEPTAAPVRQKKQQVRKRRVKHRHRVRRVSRVRAKSLPPATLPPATTSAPTAPAAPPPAATGEFGP